MHLAGPGESTVLELNTPVEQASLRERSLVHPQSTTVLMEEPAGVVALALLQVTFQVSNQKSGSRNVSGKYL